MFDSDLLQNIDKEVRDRVLCIGDIGLDRFIYGTVDRVSSERPVPVLKYKSEKFFLGCMGNVIANIKSLGGEVDAMLVTGNDDVSERIVKLIDDLQVKFFHFKDNERRTTIKERYVCGQQQLLRFDTEDNHELSEEIQNMIISKLREIIGDYKIVVLSDYNQGILTNNLCRSIIDIAKQYNVKVFVDPRSDSLSKYRNSFLVKPNLREFQRMFSVNISKRKEVLQYIEERMKEGCQVSNLLVTLGDDGMVLCGEDSLAVDAIKVDVYDVCGAGDTVMATLVTCYSRGIDLKNSVRVANIAGSLAVARFGTTTISLEELLKELHRHNGVDKKDVYLENDTLKMINTINSVRASGKIIGFTNGCFDIIHPGHISLLESARKQCDFLIVGLNDDNSIKQNKGDLRPINNQNSRTQVLKSFGYVDMVVVFSDATVDNLLKQIKPDKWFKGGDYKLENLPEYKTALEIKCEVVIIPLVFGFSTTNIIQQITSK